MNIPVDQYLNYMDILRNEVVYVVGDLSTNHHEIASFNRELKGDELKRAILDLTGIKVK